MKQVWIVDWSVWDNFDVEAEKVGLRKVCINEESAFKDLATKFAKSMDRYLDFVGSSEQVEMHEQAVNYEELCLK